MLGSIPWWVLYPGGGLLLLVTTAFLLFSLYIAYIHRKYSHIPSPKMGSFYLGHAYDVIAMRKKSGNDFEPLFKLLGKWSEEIGDLFVIFLFFSPFVVSANEEDIKRVAYDEELNKPAIAYRDLTSLLQRRFMGRGLVTILDYKTWKPRRKCYDPSFKRSSLKDLYPAFNECASIFLEKLRPLADGKKEVSMKEAFREIALDVISKVAFSSDFSKTWDHKTLGLKYTTNSKLSDLSLNAFEGAQKASNFPFSLLFQLLHPIETEVYRESVAAMRKIGRDCIEKRIKAVTSGKEVPNDILTQMLQPCIAEGGVDMETLVDDFVTFFIAGQETTANTLTFAVILIHQHPEVLDRLLSEVEDVLGDRKEVTGDDLDKMKYTEQVIKETLRMYPPAVGFVRQSPIGGITLSGHHIPENTRVTFFATTMGRKPQYFSDPDTFDPSRFDEDKPRPGPFVYFPFSVGHRSCIGRHFAMIEAKVVLTRLLQTFKVTLPPLYELVVEEKINQNPCGDVPCTLSQL